MTLAQTIGGIGTLQATTQLLAERGLPIKRL